jgi:hypothetical protein
VREGLEVCAGRPPAGCYLMDYCGMSRECAPNGRQHAHGSGGRLPILYLRGSFAWAGGRDVLLASLPLPNPAFLGPPFCGVRSINRGPSGPGRPLLAEVLRGSPSVLGEGDLACDSRFSTSAGHHMHPEPRIILWVNKPLRASLCRDHDHDTEMVSSMLDTEDFNPVKDWDWIPGTIDGCRWRDS